MADNLIAAITAENAGIVLNYGTANQAVVKGLNKLGLPVGSRSSISLSQFQVSYATEVAGEGKLSHVTGSGYLMKGDRLGQSALKKAMHKKTKLDETTRIYLDMEAEDFVTLDKATDKNGFFQVIKAGSDTATEKNNVFPFDLEMICGGQPAYFFYHLTASTIAFVATGNKITDTGNGFVTAGFEAGDTLIVEGSTNNDGQYLITSVEAGTLTLDSGVKVVVDKPVGVSITLHSGTL